MSKLDFLYFSSISNIVTDFAMLALPVIMVWNMALSTKKKLDVVTILAIGSLSVHYPSHLPHRHFGQEY